MAHFIGWVKGGRGEGSRVGTINSGIKVQAHGWYLGGIVRLWHNKAKGCDQLTATVNRGSSGNGSDVGLIQVSLDPNDNIAEAEMNMNAVAELLGFHQGQHVSFKLPDLFGDGTIEEILGNFAMVRVNVNGPDWQQSFWNFLGLDRMVRVPFDRTAIWAYKEPEAD